ncbi:1-deoxy-D-xylulose-5-phosphate reductoisomerase [Desulfuribacillus alkaliarsenatis]|uniref:1-deoxy-D-xylulose 5-phosphate reductoisomerase n=1 Tax=Desulfuribacillus alkaliarsenatis TaxID=766136 RepID=A0A1E5G620_9FIRM|nr:1-deoxy-D-xylulose-5-phosphate reductoisomerase [Desulfuribacillus alkaliarsenatis]OEF98638.1 1-deoxy-D-xylulose-5-phosphate reductoisomerase [Desulfuribacillus alkaliarsenatis]
MKKIAILGSTGSIGTQTIDIVKEQKHAYKVIGLAAGKNLEVLEQQIRELKPQIVSVENELLAKELAIRIDDVRPRVEILYGATGLITIAALKDVDILVTAVVGTLGLLPTITAIKNGTTIALANKETLVAAGSIVMDLAKQYNTKIIPVDSEHSAIFQCLQGEDMSSIKNLHVTASGGTFRGKKKTDLIGVTVEEALKHPNWSMGAKITIDSATLMNKGLEVIEAHWLFNIDYDNIKVVVHPESIIHSMVEFVDTSVIAQLGTPNMRVPIQYALSYPNRLINQQKQLDLIELGKLHFEKPDTETFQCLNIAYEAGRTGGTAPAVMNAANEVAVQLFLEKRIEFLQIEHIIREILLRHTVKQNPTLEEVIEADLWAREQILNGGEILCKQR